VIGARREIRVRRVIVVNPVPDSEIILVGSV